MKQLSEEAFTDIKKRCQETYGDTFHYESAVEAMEEALTNPEIYTKADLISKEDALGFAEWVYIDCVYDYDYQKKLWYGSNARYTTSELFTIYKQTK